MSHSLTIWIVFNVLILGLVGLDIFLTRKSPILSVKSALCWSGVWIGIALLFNLGVYVEMGQGPALQFLTGFILEKAMSIDNLFVMLLIFSYFKIPKQYQRRILFWGIIGAMVMRAVFILGGFTLLHYFHSLIYIMGAILFVTGLKLLRNEEKEVKPENNWMLRVVKKVIPITDHIEGGKFLIKKAGKWMATPLFTVLVVVETTDLIFALDSVPAIMAITQDSFLVYSSNIFAILGLRALYFALEGMLGLFKYLQVGLGGVLVFIGGKMIGSPWIEIPVWASLLVIVALIGSSILYSIFAPQKQT